MKTKKRFFLFPLLFMAMLVFLVPACSDDDNDDDDNSTVYTEADIIGEWHGEANDLGEIEVLMFNEDNTSWFGFITESSNDVEWMTTNDTWELDGDVVTTEEESGYVLEYEIQMQDTVMTLVDEEGIVFNRAEGSGDDGGDDGDEEYTMQTMAGTFSNVAERIKVELFDDGSVILTKVEGSMPGQDGEVDENATWEIDNYETPAGVPGDNPLSIIIEHSNSEFDEPYVLVIESQDELYDHWQKTLTRVEEEG